MRTLRLVPLAGIAACLVLLAGGRAVTAGGDDGTAAIPGSGRSSEPATLQCRARLSLTYGETKQVYSLVYRVEVPDQIRLDIAWTEPNPLSEQVRDFVLAPDATIIISGRAMYCTPGQPSFLAGKEKLVSSSLRYAPFFPEYLETLRALQEGVARLPGGGQRAASERQAEGSVHVFDTPIEVLPGVSVRRVRALPSGPSRDGTVKVVCLDDADRPVMQICWEYGPADGAGMRSLRRETVLIAQRLVKVYLGHEGSDKWTIGELTRGPLQIATDWQTLGDGVTVLPRAREIVDEFGRTVARLEFSDYRINEPIDQRWFAPPETLGLPPGVSLRPNGMGEDR